MDTVKSRNFFKNIGIGALIAIVPFVNFLCLEYLYKIGKSGSRDFGKFPDWEISSSYFKQNFFYDIVNGMITFLEFFIFFIIPTTMFYAIFGLFGQKIFGGCVGMLVGAPLFACAMVFGEKIGQQNVKNLRWKAKEVYKSASANASKLAIPAVLFVFFQMISCIALSKILVVSTLFIGMAFFVKYIRELDTE